MFEDLKSIRNYILSEKHTGLIYTPECGNRYSPMTLSFHLSKKQKPEMGKVYLCANKIYMVRKVLGKKAFDGLTVISFECYTRGSLDLKFLDSGSHII